MICTVGVLFTGLFGSEIYFLIMKKKVLIDITYSLVVCISLLYLVYKKFMATIILIQLILVLHIMLLSPVLFFIIQIRNHDDSRRDEDLISEYSNTMFISVIFHTALSRTYPRQLSRATLKERQKYI